VRENTEDLYCGNGGIVRKGTPHEIATQEMVATRFGVERVIRFAFEFARKKKQAGTGRGHLTHVNKTNVLTFSGDVRSLRLIFPCFCFCLPCLPSLTTQRF